ncbi:hypothetical protein [Streptococcus ovuberis]|uniref:Uncharacterized protein n=1 Tax=Streptococcus ovuberis TaxID=1936207 RepID=A0A7X6MYG0_9STRE|nr:hypothetical protein [Streptococcus ovuberis]NKZ19783.1 hypothetical protein [Streptococcus ovuberis]
MNKKELYADYPNFPYISAGREDLDEPGFKPVPRKNMEDLGDGLLAGDIILLWRVAFGTFTTESVMPKYLEYTYGINGESHLQQLVGNGYVEVDSAYASLVHINAASKKAILKEKEVRGLSKLKSSELDCCLKTVLTEEELGQYFAVRGYSLTPKGQETLVANQAVIDRHPKKKF